MFVSISQVIGCEDRLRNDPVASFRGHGGSADPPRIVKCKSFALSVSSKGSLYISHNGR